MLLPGPGCRREVLLAGSRITLLSPFSHLVLVMKMGMFPSQFSAETALSRADCMGRFFLFQPPDTSHREHWAKLEDRRGTEGLSAPGRWGYPKLWKTCKGVKHLCGQQNCAEVTTDSSCSGVGNPRVQSFSQFEKSRTIRKGK